MTGPSPKLKQTKRFLPTISFHTTNSFSLLLSTLSTTAYRIMKQLSKHSDMLKPYWYTLSRILVLRFTGQTCSSHTITENSLAINLSHHLSVADECNWSQKHQAPCFFFPHMWQTSGHCKGVHVTSQPPKQAVYKVRVTEKEDLTNYQTLAGVKSWTSTRPSPAPQGDTSSEIHSHKVGHNWVIGF